LTCISIVNIFICYKLNLEHVNLYLIIIFIRNHSKIDIISWFKTIKVSVFVSNTISLYFQYIWNGFFQFTIYFCYQWLFFLLSFLQKSLYLLSLSSFYYFNHVGKVHNTTSEIHIIQTKYLYMNLGPHFFSIYNIYTAYT